MALALRLRPADDPTDEGPRGSEQFGLPSGEDEGLPYKVEVWDGAGSCVEHVLAITASASIGYAAYYAATREFPARVIILRHKTRVLSRWNGQPH